VNLPDMEHRYKNALHAHSLTVELLSKLGSNDDNASIEQACRLERGAWERLEAARLALIGAYLERLGL
jgi:hypothetical protein